MKQWITVILKSEVEKEIEVNLPYYFKQDLLIDEADIIIFGKINLENTQKIKIEKDWQGNIITIEVTEQKTNTRLMSDYFQINYVSSKEEFNKAISDATNVLSVLKGLGD